MPMAASSATGSTGRSRARAAADGSILRSKITVPGLPAWAVPRPRLDRLIAEGVRGPLTARVTRPGRRASPGQGLLQLGDERK